MVSRPGIWPTQLLIQQVHRVKRLELQAERSVTFLEWVKLHNANHRHKFTTWGCYVPVTTKYYRKWRSPVSLPETKHVTIGGRLWCNRSQSQSYIMTDGQPASLSWNKAPIWGLRPDLDYGLTVAGLLVWGALSDERTGLSFAIATGSRQRSHFLVRVL
jgi:hypothetical protein